MRKKSDGEIVGLQVDQITGNYYVVIPEWMANELSWYEDIQIRVSLENGEIVLTEDKYD
jgi:hypothetical protein